jgi:secondary thiamine-phosphate synthase enzyme
VDTLSLKTEHNKQVADITELVQGKLGSGETGSCTVFVAHTTAAITTADLDPGTDLDMLDAFEAMIPKLNYRHPHNPAHVPDHILSALIGPSVTIPVADGRLVLGSWQRIVLFEFDGPRERTIHLTVHR